MDALNALSGLSARCVDADADEARLNSGASNSSSL